MVGAALGEEVNQPPRESSVGLDDGMLVPTGCEPLDPAGDGVSQNGKYDDEDGTDGVGVGTSDDMPPPRVPSVGPSVGTPD